MKANVLSEERMRELGFTDFVKDSWYLFKIIDEIIITDEKFSISYNLIINKENQECKIEILDERTLKSLDYKENHKLCKKINKFNKYLIKKGVLNDDCLI